MAKNFKAWPKDWPKSLNYPEIPIYAFLDQTAIRVPNRLAIIFGGMELTYKELKELTDRFAAALADLGVRKGDRVAIHLPNCPQFAIAYYATLRLGGIFTPLSPLLAPPEAAYQLNDSGAETLISLDLLFPGISSVIPETKVRRVITTSIADCFNAVSAPLKPIGKLEVPDTIDMASLLKQYEPHTEEVSIDVTRDLAHLAYTGGTTGLSKGVMLTHANVVANVLQFGNWFSGAQIEMVDGVLKPVYPPGVDPVKDRPIVQDQETALVVVPWFHAMGTVGYLNNPIFGGITMVVFPRFDPREYIEAVGKYRATMLGGAPQLYIPLVNLPDFKSYDLSGIKFAGSGAAPLALPVLEKMHEAFSGMVVEAYGLTECTMGATSNPPDRASVRPGSVGIPVFDTELKVVDLDTGKDLPPGEEGEICIRGPQVMQGYWNKPEETANVLKNGWLFTGDIGREDEGGYFFITDRKKDMIIYKGYNVYPREIEEVIFKHPAVQQCAVVGKPDLEVGESPVAFVELKQGVQATGDEILEFTNSKIAHYKKIRDVIFLEAIPVSGAGKVLKKELRERLKQG
ncbi:MAG: long-chain fatty acid--CoA ligase [Deltaproteobacteria bacterium]|nr:MAG: long-chain fatty acid--CoA ligase [Deltaproteobacteria bacterium]